MSDEIAFLLEIANNPDDDFPRLVFADWLHEHGDQRADLIPIQCELGLKPRSNPPRSALEQQEWKLLPLANALWKQQLDGFRSYNDQEFVLERGIPVWLLSSLAEFTQLGDSILELIPTVSGIIPTDSWYSIYHDWNRWTRNPERQLSLKDLLQSRVFQRIDKLDLTRSFWDYSELVESIDDGRCSHLKCLKLQGLSSTPDSSTMALFSCFDRASLPSLEHLDIHGLHISERMISSLIQLSHNSTLHHLSLKSLMMSDDQLRVWQAGHWQSLSHLDLSDNQLTDACIDLLANLKWNRLKYLLLSHTLLTIDGVRKLLDSPLGEQLELIDLRSLSLTSKVKTHLVYRYGEKLIL